MSKPIALFLAVIVIAVIVGWFVISYQNQARQKAIDDARAPYQTVEKMLNEITPTGP